MNLFLKSLNLIRVHNCFMAMIGVGLGAFMTWNSPVIVAPLLASVAAFLVCAAGNAFNDLVDMEIDRINRPKRQLVSGGLSKSFAFWLSIICNLLAIISIMFVNLASTLAVILAIALLFLYNLRLKHFPLVGNATVALLGGLTFITGGLAIDAVQAFELPGPVIPALFAFLLHLVREIVKDVEDIEGDRRAGIKTLPQLIGIQPALMVAMLFFITLVILTLVPVYFGWFGRIYEILAVYVVDLPMLALLIFIWGNPTEKMLKLGSFTLKFAMAIGGIALYLA